MKVSSVTIGLPVSDLEHSVAWYRRVFALNEPELEPADGVVEFPIGPIWLQLNQEPSVRSGAEAVTRFGVPDAAVEHHRLSRLGVSVDPLQHVAGAVDYFDFADPDGNRLSIYSMAP